MDNYGFTGLARGEAVLPDGTLDAAEYLRLMAVNKDLLERAIKEEVLLKGYVDEPHTIPVQIIEKYTPTGYGRALGGYQESVIKQIEQELIHKRHEINQHYNYVFSLTCNHTIIDGEAFRAKMSPLLVHHMETLMQTKHDEAERIVGKR